MKKKKKKTKKKTENSFNVLLTIALSFCQPNVYIQCHETFESLKFAKYIHDRVHAFSLQTVI